jgi:RNA polymerase sigma-70 factor, ECF subfamily
MQGEAQLLAAAAAGDARARTAVLQQVAPDFRRLIFRFGTRGAEEDELQELFAHLLEVLPRFRPGGAASFGTWAHTVAHRWLLMERRRRHLVSVPLEAADGVADARLDVHKGYEGKEAHRALEAALARLPEAQRRCFVLSQLHEQPLEAVAEAEDVPLGTVKSRLHRARAELVLALGDLLDDDGKGEQRAAGR